MTAIDLASLLILALCGALASPLGGALLGAFAFEMLPQAMDAASLPATLGLLLAAGAGAMFYLSVTELVPQAESHQYQQSSAIAMGLGLLAIFTLSSLS